MGCTSIEFLQVVVNHLAYCISNAECRYLAEVHALDSFAAQGRSNRRTRACLAGSYNELDDLVSCRHLSRHLNRVLLEILILDGVKRQILPLRHEDSNATYKRNAQRRSVG